MKNLDHTPIACSLTTAELRDREATLLAQFKSAVVETEEVEDGYAFRLPDDGESIQIAANLIMAERECCPFLAFNLVVEPSKELVIVRVTGPTGTKEFLRSILCETEERT